MSLAAVGFMAHLRNHWDWRPDWAIDRPCLLWYLTFQTQLEPGAWAMRVQHRLAEVKVLDLVPPEWLHLTIDDVGFVDQLSNGQLLEVVAEARSLLKDWQAPQLTLGPVTTMGDAVVLCASPKSELAQLRARLRAASAVVLGDGGLDALHEFDPHVSFAYVNTACDQRTVLEPIGAMAAEETVVNVSSVTLVAATRRNRHYQWTTAATLGISGSSESSMDRSGSVGSGSVGGEQDA